MRLRRTEALVACLNMAVEAGLQARSGRVITVSTKAGVVSLLDEEDGWAASRAWHSHKSGRNLYLCTAYAPDLHVALHNHILPARPRTADPGGRVDVDHVDGDSLNNRRWNLRYATHGTNVAKGFEPRA